MAETFLVRCFKPITDLETFDDLRSIAMLSSWSLKKNCSCLQGSIFIEHTIKDTAVGSSTIKRCLFDHGG